MSSKDWIADKSTGSYYKLLFGRVLQCPMNSNGSRDDTVNEVEDIKEAQVIFNKLIKKLRQVV